jgi:hypothetical protein
MPPNSLSDEGKPGTVPAAPQMLRIYWLTEAFYPPIVGGQELFASQIVQALALKGREPERHYPPDRAAITVRRAPGPGQGAQISAGGKP